MEIGPFQGQLAQTALVVGGLGLMVLTMAKGVDAMEGMHWVMLLVVAAVAFAFARTQTGANLASKVGLS